MEDITKKETWCLHVLLLFGLRALVHQLWSSYACMLFLNRANRINQKGMDFNQIDAEWHWYDFQGSNFCSYYDICLRGMLTNMGSSFLCWLCDRDNFLIFQAVAAAFLCLSFPSLVNLPMWDLRGLLCCLILHVGFSEPLYYWLHRLLHSSTLYEQYHWFHHGSKVLHPFTGKQNFCQLSIQGSMLVMQLTVLYICVLQLGMQLSWNICWFV